MKDEKSIHVEFRKITTQIKKCEQKQIKNNRQIRQLHRDNAFLQQTINELKTKRHRLVFDIEGKA